MRQARTVTEVARTLGVDEAVLRAIEEETLAETTKPAVARGYIRMYARALGLDAEAILRGDQPGPAAPPKTEWPSPSPVLGPPASTPTPGSSEAAWPAPAASGLPRPPMPPARASGEEAVPQELSHDRVDAGPPRDHLHAGQAGDEPTGRPRPARIAPPPRVVLAGSGLLLVAVGILIGFLLAGAVGQPPGGQATAPVPARDALADQERLAADVTATATPTPSPTSAPIRKPTVTITPALTPAPADADEPAGADDRPPEEISVQVVDGSDDEQAYAEAITLLEEAGYQVIAAGASRMPADETLVLFNDGYEDEARTLRRLDPRLARTAPNDRGFTTEVMVTVLVGSDWADAAR